MASARLEVGGGVGITPRGIVEDAAVQCGAGELVVALERTGVIAQGLVVATQRLVGQCPVEVALGRVVGQRDADAEGVESVFESAELVGAEPLVEVGPEVLRPEIDGLLELNGGAGVFAVAEVGATQVAMLPGRPRLRQDVAASPGAVGPTEGLAVGAAEAFQRGARAEQGSRLVEPRERLAAGFAGLGSGRQADAEIGPDR